MHLADTRFSFFPSFYCYYGTYHTRVKNKNRMKIWVIVHNESHVVRRPLCRDTRNCTYKYAWIFMFFLKLYLSLFSSISIKLIVYTYTHLSIFIKFSFYSSNICTHNKIRGAPTIPMISAHVWRHSPPIGNSPLSVFEIYQIFNNLTRNSVNNCYFNFLNSPVFSAVLYWRLGPIANLRFGEN